MADRLSAMLVKQLGNTYLKSRIQCIRLVTLRIIAIEERKQQQWTDESYSDGQLYGPMQEVLNGYCGRTLGSVSRLLNVPLTNWR
ncbi:hypothetical protein [Zooshikella sp. RANM57]|uniref:hypothetical protein n=1 Tax=Zooshikella sp. RANM57 TaxID=3425863 RepID=UPI003D6FD000